MNRRHLLAGLGLVAAITLLFAAPAAAGESPTPEDLQEGITDLGVSINLLWIVIGAVLVIFMQAGFGLLETGFCRAKNAAHVMSTNFAVFGLGYIAFFIIGYSLMFGGYSYVLPGFDYGYGQPIGDALFKVGDWVFLWKGDLFMTGDAALPAILGFFLYMVAFMDTTATIPTGAMAERWRWRSFILWGLFCGALYFPLFGAFTWGGGWLSQLGNNVGLGAGYVDFAGSGVVHAMGGIAALAGALVLGARLGKFGPDGKPRALPGHHIPMALLGTFILLVGWFGFNAASTLAATDVQFATIATNTASSAAFGAIAAMVWIMLRTGKPDPGMMANGMLAGLVGITAPCAFVDPWAATVIGTVAGVLVVESVFFIERRMKVDDPVGAVSVHGTCGVWGVLAVGIFANGKYGAGWNLTEDLAGVSGIIKGLENADQLLAQAIGAAVIVFGFGFFAWVFFKLCDVLFPDGIRTSEDDEIAGLDLPEMGVLAYPDFAGTHESYSAGAGDVTTPVGTPV